MTALCIRKDELLLADGGAHREAMRRAYGREGRELITGTHFDYDAAVYVLQINRDPPNDSRSTARSRGRSHTPSLPTSLPSFLPFHGFFSEPTVMGETPWRRPRRILPFIAVYKEAT